MAMTQEQYEKDHLFVKQLLEFLVTHGKEAHPGCVARALLSSGAYASRRATLDGILKSGREKAFIATAIEEGLKQGSLAHKEKLAEDSRK